MNYKIEIVEDPNKITKQKKASFTVVVLTFLCGAFVITTFAQQGWKLIPIPTETSDAYKRNGLFVTEEVHTDGRRRTIAIEFFPDTKIPKVESVTVKEKEVPLTTYTTKKWNDQGEQIAYSEEFFDKNGKRFEGRKWYFSVDGNGRIVGAKTEEDYNSETGKWEIRPEGKSPLAKDLPENTAQSGLLGKWKVVESLGEGEAKLVIEFRQERDGIAGYIVQINDERLKSLGFEANELVYRRFLKFKENYAECECRYRYSDTDANGLTKKQTGWSVSGVTFRDRLSSGSHCVVNQVEGNFRSKTVREKD
ncbi:MAG: hypothetical protein ACRD6X_08015 [Pyrinomonadaceae bacterium]